MAQGGGKPTFIVPKGLRRKKATTTINKLLANPHVIALEDDFEVQNLKVDLALCSHVGGRLYQFCSQAMS
jgi:hypothetical protein